MLGEAILVCFIIVGLIGRSNILATAASILLILKLTHLQRWFPMLERRGLELGLLFLMLSVLIPLVNGQVRLADLWLTFLTPSGLFAVIGGVLATSLNGQGLALLKEEPQIMVGLVLGSILGIVLFRGIPVGPLMAAALASLLLKMMNWLR